MLVGICFSGRGGGPVAALQATAFTTTWPGFSRGFCCHSLQQLLVAFSAF
jgi:hypothetical protein